VKDTVSNAPQRDLHMRRINRFRAWHAANANGTGEPDRHALLRYGAEVGSEKVIRDLEKSFRANLSDDDPFLGELIAARLDHIRRKDDIPMVVEITAAPWWAPFRQGADLDRLSYAQVKHIDRFLRWITEKGITRPNRETFLSYVADAKSPSPLLHLQRAFDQLKGVTAEAIIIELPQAITEKFRAARPEKPKRKRGHPRQLSIPPEDLPDEMRAALAAMRRRERREGRKPPARDIVNGIEGALCQFGHVCRVNGYEVVIMPETIRAYLLEIESRTSRAATLSIRGTLLLAFIRYSGIGMVCEPSLKEYANRQNKTASRQVPQKESKARDIAGPSAVLSRAVDLLAKARDERTVTWRMTRLNHGLALAFTMLLPLRVQDTVLNFGTNIVWSGEEYWIDTRTQKTKAPVYGALPHFLTPFIDAVLLQGREPSLIEKLRAEAERDRRPLFLKGNGKPPMRSFVSHVWSVHFNTGNHIARTLVHDTLGKKGVEGVAEALALCAQRDPRTALFYQTRALADARRVQALATLVAEFSENDMEEYFPDLDVS
jgi:hypothetical protein